jgi:hypothetical protein
MLKKMLIAAAVAAGTSACSTRLTEFTAISTKNLSLKGERHAKKALGKSCTRVALFIPFSFQNLKEAIDNAIESAGPGYDALEDGVLSTSWLTVGVYTQQCYEVTGTAVKTKEATGAGSDALVLSSVGASSPEALGEACAQLSNIDTAACVAALSGR